MRIPVTYWLIQFQIIRVEQKKQWENMLRPTAELIGQISNPQVYKVYHEAMKREEQKKLGKEVSWEEERDKDMLGKSYNSFAETETHYDPRYGIVDKNGRIIIPKEKCDNLIGMDGIAISE